MTTVNNVVEDIRKHSEFTYLEDEVKSNSKNIDFLKSINFSAVSLLQVINEEPNDNLFSWKELVKANNLKDVHVNVFIVSSFVLIYVASKEFLRYSGLASSAKKAIDTLEECLENNKSSDYYSSIIAKIEIYENYISFALQEERTRRLYELSLDEKFNHALMGHEQRIEKIKSKLDYNMELLESIESETGYASLIHGFKEYAKKLNEKKRKLTVETNNIKYLLFLIPTLSAFLSLTMDVGYGFYLSAISAMALLGLLLRVNIRKEDQLDQVFTKIDNRIALSMFYRYQVVEGSEEDKKTAASNFNSFIYSEIETSDWNAPDISEGIVKILKEYNR
ncbi:hypothetical protein AAGW18_17940 [Vreelandella titanicae]|uniref:hypothetical protein n=1 Tax=Vreelandella titanicae TaxID=664683 RepID=UPI00241CFCE6|nr:hypothetical protein [Halomonas titanicae]